MDTNKKKNDMIVMRLIRMNHPAMSGVLPLHFILKGSAAAQAETCQ